MNGFITEIKKLNLKDLESTENNPQRMDDKTFSGLVESIKRKGWYFSLPDVWEYNPGKFRIISGHHRSDAAIKAGILEQNCNVITDSRYTEEQAKKDLLESNERHGEPAQDLLTDYVTDLMADYDLDLDTLVEEIGLRDLNLYDMDTFGESFDLPDGDKEPFQQITFTLADDQADFIQEQLKTAKKDNTVETFGNENSNGNALYRIIKEWSM